MTKTPAEKAADEVRDVLMKDNAARGYNRGVNDAVKSMKRRWEEFGEDE